MKGLPNFHAAVPYVVDAGLSHDPCYACENTENNRRVLVDARGIAGVPDGHVPYFSYLVCHRCGSLDLINRPDDDPALYADGYYSFNPKPRPLAERWAMSVRNRHELSGTGVVGKALARAFPAPDLRAMRPLLNGTLGLKLDRASRILDVGCGTGKWLSELAAEGFSNLVGADPFLKESTTRGPVRLIKADVSELEDTFDLIVAHHAFEHIADGANTLRTMQDRLAPGGLIVIRIPVADSYGWTRYGGHWIQLDPPRHMHLYSATGLRLLAKRCSLDVVSVKYDAFHFMVTGSEARMAGMRPHKKQNIVARGIQKTFSRSRGNRIAEFANRLDMGDQAAFYLKPA